MTTAGAKLLTVEEFRRLPEDSGEVYHELRHGTVYAMTRPKVKHMVVQRNLRELLTAHAEPGSFVETQLPFRPLPEHNLLVADVAYLTAGRFQQARADDEIYGAPQIVIEVLSPSNTASEIFDKEMLCLDNGAREFWVVDPERRQVKVALADGHTFTYRSGQQIPVQPLGGAKIAVDAIFA